MQADWTQKYNFVVMNDASHAFTFLKTNEGSPFTFDAEMIPDGCTCSSWQPCVCEKDENGTYLTQHECEHDGMNYNTCCSQVNAPIPVTITPLAVPLINITPSAPPLPLIEPEELDDTY